ncbi:MAG: hypothetical protein R2715_09155 [Ilumatobacteraceae bacterium]
MDVGPVVAHVDRDPGRSETVQDGEFAQVAAADVVAHLGEHEGDGTHPGATDAHDVVSARHRQVDGDGRRRPGGHILDQLNHERSTRSIKARSCGAAPGAAGGSGHALSQLGVGEQAFDPARRAVPA